MPFIICYIVQFCTVKYMLILFLYSTLYIFAFTQPATIQHTIVFTGRATLYICIHAYE